MPRHRVLAPASREIHVINHEKSWHAQVHANNARETHRGGVLLGDAGGACLGRAESGA